MQNLLIAGLGNPGEKYEKTRHNIGFLIIDFLATNKNVAFSKEKKHQALIGSYTEKERKTFLVKPETFMNKSGLAVGSLVNYYDLTRENVLVIHDDSDLDFGKMKLSKGSGSAGHRGVQSIINALGTLDFFRLRIGVRPKGFFSRMMKPKASSFVLKKFSRKETAQLEQLKMEALERVGEFLR